MQKHQNEQQFKCKPLHFNKIYFNLNIFHIQHYFIWSVSFCARSVSLYVVLFCLSIVAYSAHSCSPNNLKWNKTKTDKLSECCYVAIAHKIMTQVEFISIFVVKKRKRITIAIDKGKMTVHNCNDSATDCIFITPKSK